MFVSVDQLELAREQAKAYFRARALRDMWAERAALTPTTQAADALEQAQRKLSFIAVTLADIVTAILLREDQP